MLSRCSDHLRITHINWYCVYRSQEEGQFLTKILITVKSLAGAEFWTSNLSTRILFANRIWPFSWLHTIWPYHTCLKLLDFVEWGSSTFISASLEIAKGLHNATFVYGLFVGLGFCVTWFDRMKNLLWRNSGLISKYFYLVYICEGLILFFAIYFEAKAVPGCCQWFWLFTGGLFTKLPFESCHNVYFTFTTSFHPSIPYDITLLPGWYMLELV